ncbi:MAG: tetratricopeptide repeat protein [Vicinamibacteria bacterium]
MKRALVAVLFLIGLGFVTAPASAQTGSCRGKVVDDKGQPVVDAKVTIEYQGGITRKFETKTNKKGEFMQVGMQPGPYRFTVAKEGFAPAVSENRIGLGDATELPQFKLAPASQAAGENVELKTKFMEAVKAQSDGKLDEAAEMYKVILQTSPDVPEVHQNLGSIYLQKKDYPAAEAAYTKALELRPGSADITASLAAVYRESGQGDKAMALMTKAAGENPNDPKAQFNKGIYLLNANQSEDAIKAFEAAVAADPNMAEAYFRLGTLMVGQNKIPEAITNLEKYLSLNPTEAQNVATAQGLLKAIKK